MVIPFSRGAVLVDLNVGVLYLFAITSLTFPALFVAGWSSNNKYAMMGGMRAVAQLLAFEVPLTLSVLGIVLLAGSLSTQDIVKAQQRIWFIFPQIIGAALFLVCGMAENAVNPFDLPEGESELVVGYYVEYSGFLFGLFTLAEIGTTFTLGALFTTFFLGGWQAPVSFLSGAPPVLWFVMKTYLMFFLLVGARFSLPRFRIDQILTFGWKVLVPLSFVNLLIAAIEGLAWGPYFTP